MDGKKSRVGVVCKCFELRSWEKREIKVAFLNLSF